MSGSDGELRAFLKDKAGSVSADPRGFQPTMRRARRRRAAIGATAVVLAIAVLSGGVVLGRSLVDDGEALPPVRPRPDTETVTEDDWDGSLTNDYPEIARGSFRGRRWVLEGRQAELAPRVDKLDLTFTLESPDGPVVATGEVFPDDDVMHENELVLPDGSAHVIFGSTLNGIHTIQAMLDDGSRHQALIFTGYNDRSTITAQYFVLFLPPGADGVLYARDFNGVDGEGEPIGDTPQRRERPDRWLSGSFNDLSWHVNGRRTKRSICLKIVLDDDVRQEECFEEPDEGAATLQLATVTKHPEVKGLVGVLPVDMQDLRLEIGGRSVSLHYELQPHPDIGFPFAVVVAADAHGRISAEPSGGGERVSLPF